MKFSVRDDIEAPIDFVFAQVSDFAAFERLILRRGATVERQGVDGNDGLGARWKVDFVFRGKPREVLATVTAFDPPGNLAISSASSGIDGLTTVELLALSKSRTRLSFAQELKPNTLAAWLMIQSLKLAKSSLESRLRLRTTEFAKDVERRWRSQS
ncbi:SRPBCC family protein [Roseisalinus antarcticus]|uniref:Polyketide cyclase / dehydrase and lipid transport n=1 Tax=Roseisalinus antarcticus TaxID=254357 RepID=A0A1Y5RTS8_9RHOB|nr:SRPBCC family protein [Roseisalinus antarcticus]SLN22547.1 Polyketide cyclase / dehydrase and lipid transport [Roseisalinus antarcticus]